MSIANVQIRERPPEECHVAVRIPNSRGLLGITGYLFEPTHGTPAERAL
jgi:hypothetical protein